MKVVTPTQDSALPVVIAAKPSKTTVTAIQHAAQYKSSAKSDSMGCTLYQRPLIQPSFVMALLDRAIQQARVCALMSPTFSWMARFCGP